MVNDILLNLWRNSRKNHGKNRQNIIFDRAFKGIIMEKKNFKKQTLNGTSHPVTGIYLRVNSQRCGKESGYIPVYSIIMTYIIALY
jgi:hypothetical protein